MILVYCDHWKHASVDWHSSRHLRHCVRCWQNVALEKLEIDFESRCHFQIFSHFVVLLFVLCLEFDFSLHSALSELLEQQQLWQFGV